MNNYMIEISDTHGDGIASEEFSQFEASTSIPIPNVGDLIYLPSGCGADGKQSQEVKVLNRIFTYTPEDQNGDISVHVQLLCRDSNSKTES